MHNAKQKLLTFLKQSWIDKTKGCSLCVKYAGTADQGKWIADPVPVKFSKKLYRKADKYARSVVHRIYVETNKTCCSEQDAATKEIVACSAHSDESRSHLLNLLKLANFLFTNEIHHTTGVCWYQLLQHYMVIKDLPAVCNACHAMAITCRKQLVAYLRHLEKPL